MAYEKCPQCGGAKHQLMACPTCEFTRAKHFDTTKLFKNKRNRQSQEASATSEKCPQCGGAKHQLMACPTCGFTRAKRFDTTKLFKNKRNGRSQEASITTGIEQKPLKEEPRIICPLCHSLFRKDRMLKHLRSIHGIRTSKITSQKRTKVTNVSAGGKEYKVCPQCGCRLRPSRFNKHMSQQHGSRTKKQEDAVTPSISVDDNSELTTCPQCDISVKKKNLKKHIRRIHEKKKINLTRKRNRGEEEKSEITPLPSFEMTPAVAAELLKAMKDTRLVTDKKIAEYLRKNPAKREMNKFGVPQDKYRWGFYGSKSMEYDVWGKGDKEK